MRLLKIELSGEHETYGNEFFHQDKNPSEEVTRKIWDNRKKAAFLMMWEVDDKSNKSDRLLLDCLISHELLAMKSIGDLKSWIQDTKQRTLSF